MHLLLLLLCINVMDMQVAHRLGTQPRHCSWHYHSRRYYCCCRCLAASEEAAATLLPRKVTRLWVCMERSHVGLCISRKQSHVIPGLCYGQQQSAAILSMFAAIYSCKSHAITAPRAWSTYAMSVVGIVTMVMRCPWKVFSNGLALLSS